MELMKHIPLTRGLTAIVDDDDYETLSLRRWQTSSTGYAKNSTTVNGKNITVLMHRQVLSAPPGRPVDHINGNTLDNRKSNLRLCTVSQNAANSKTPTDNKTGFKGVHTTKRSASFEASIGYKNRQYYIGRFKTPHAAAMAYNKKAKEFFGEYAKLNEV